MLAGAGCPPRAASNLRLLYRICKYPNKHVATKAGRPIPIPTPKAIRSEPLRLFELEREEPWSPETTAAVVSDVVVKTPTDPFPNVVV